MLGGHVGELGGQCCPEVDWGVVRACKRVLYLSASASNNVKSRSRESLRLCLSPFLVQVIVRDLLSFSFLHFCFVFYYIFSFLLVANSIPFLQHIGSSSFKKPWNPLDKGLSSISSSSSESEVGPCGIGKIESSILTILRFWPPHGIDVFIFGRIEIWAGKTILWLGLRS